MWTRHVHLIINGQRQRQRQLTNGPVVLCQTPNAACRIGCHAACTAPGAHGVFDISLARGGG